MEIGKSLLVSVSLVTMMTGLLIAAQWQSDIVHFNENGKMVYEPEPYSGHRIGDFSHAGYMGGGIDLPTVPTVLTISSTGGDDTLLIQNAIDTVSALTPDSNGIRGALLLQSGTYNISDSLYVTTSGVVIRGKGDGAGASDTIIYRLQNYDTTNGDWNDPAYKEGVLTFKGIGADTKNNHYVNGTTCNITDDYIPVGSRVFHVEHPEYYSIGDRVVIDHPDTSKWLDSVDYGGTDWKVGDVNINAARRVLAKNGNAIAVDAPIFFDIDKSLTQATISVFDPKDRLAQVGVEDLRVDMETDGNGTHKHANFAIRFTGVDDSWALRSTGKHFQVAGLHFNGTSRMTVRGCSAINPHYDGSGGKGYNFYHLSAQQMLIENCYASNARHAYICNGSGRDNANVYLNNTGHDNKYASEGHYRWVNGLLFDNHYEDSDNWNHIGFQRMGIGHGWATVHSVAWNCTVLNSGTIIVQRPPRAQNYAIGCSAVVTGGGRGSWQDGPDGWMEGTNKTDLYPSSLYEAQLAQRLANPIDTVPPSAPVNAETTSGNARVSLNWTANSENDIAGYNVYRRAESDTGFEKINASLLVSPAYTDTQVLNDITFYYVITAEDVFANESTDSFEIYATPTTIGATAITDTFYAIEDTWINDNSKQVDNIYGNDTDLQTRKGETETYIKFAVSGLYGSINSATLRIYNYQPAEDTVYAYAVSSNSWGQNILTWNNSTLSFASQLDSIATSLEGWYQFDVTSHITGDGIFTIGMDQNGSDKQKYYSREYENASYAPQLVVNYTPIYYRMADFAQLAKYWLSDCNAANNWCQRMDHDHLNGIDIYDLYEFASRWLDEP